MSSGEITPDLARSTREEFIGLIGGRVWLFLCMAGELKTVFSLKRFKSLW